MHKEESKVLNTEKLNRKLACDTVNEILVEKLALVEATMNPNTAKASSEENRELLFGGRRRLPEKYTCRRCDDSIWELGRGLC